MTAADLPAGAPHPELDRLIAVLERLRAPGGCAWDREQTHETLVQYLIEEAFELVDALEAGAVDDRVEELGDVLYQVLFHADIAAEAGEFTLEDVAARATAKMVGRHPHVFGDVVAETPDAVAANWDRIKAVEKSHRTSVLDGIPGGMPALALADKTIGRAAKAGVEVDPGVAPVDATAGASGTEAELGDRLLTIVAAARAQGLDAERALRGAIRALGERVRAAEAGAAADAAGAASGTAPEAATE